MNKRALVAAIAAAASGAACAQSNAQVYGLLDAGIEHVTNADASGEGTTRVYSGGSNNSRLGFRGTEDLGGGLKAVFNLEAGLLIDAGASDGPLFRRQANVGLEGRLGRIVLGRSFTTVYDFVNPFDPMGYAPRYSWIPGGGGTLSSKYGMTTAFDNMVKYQGQFGGLKIGASYGAGEVAGSEADGRKFAAASAYEMGPLRVVVTGERVNGTTSAAGIRPVSRVYHAATAYQVTEAVSLKLGLRNYKLERGTGSDVRANTWWTGTNVQVTPAVDLSAVVYYQDIKAGVTPGDTAADPKMFVVRAKYALSKRTSVYATAAHARASGGVPVGVSRDSSEDGGVTGFADHQTAVLVGIQHRF
ncbi:porin [Massilia niastensis]|uniref:porin n=1 Tax=Massilia niastensis TaxID=544911 RepID=UPI000477BC4B|nr:porin [Massilia niastensis]